jgi:nitrogen fixation protein FixH
VSKSKGKIWPYAIGMSITLVFGFCVATIVVTSKANIQESNAYMTYYQDADAKANDLIKAQMAFNKKYKIEYISQGISESGSTLHYRVTDINSNPVNNAKLIVAISRPETNEFDVTLENPKVENGVYIFENVKFPKAGVWNIIAKVSVGDDYRFYNIKADTRIKEAFEF